MDEDTTDRLPVIRGTIEMKSPGHSKSATVSSFTSISDMPGSIIIVVVCSEDDAAFLFLGSDLNQDNY